MNVYKIENFVIKKCNIVFKIRYVLSIKSYIIFRNWFMFNFIYLYRIRFLIQFTLFVDVLMSWIFMSYAKRLNIYYIASRFFWIIYWLINRLNDYKTNHFNNVKHDEKIYMWIASFLQFDNQNNYDVYYKQFVFVELNTTIKQRKTKTQTCQF